MRRCFSKAYSVAEPDFIIFLGDLFDEGVQMRENTEQFEWTLHRFNEIFETNNQTSVGYFSGLFWIARYLLFVLNYLLL